MQSQSVKATMKSFESLTDNDVEAAKAYLPNPENYTMKSILNLDF
jgi:hypothetical protein